MAINVTEELNKINDLIKANGKLTAKDRNAIPQMEMPARDPKRDRQTRRLADQLARDVRGAQGMLGQDAAVCDAELDHQLFFSVMSHQCNIHTLSPSAALTLTPNTVFLSGT